MLIKDQAICIRSVDYSETSQIVTFLTDIYGKIHAIAKGSKRPRSAFGGPIEPLTYGSLVILDKPHAQLATLTEFQPRFEIVRGLTRDLGAYNAAMLAIELVDRFTKDRDPHPGLYPLLVDFLRQLVETREVLPRLVGFELALLRHVGIQLVWDCCANCRRPYTESWQGCFFSSSANGVICRDCEGAFPDRLILDPIVPRVISDPACLRSIPLPLLAQLERILIGHMTNVLGQGLRAAGQFLKGLACQGQHGP